MPIFPLWTIYAGGICAKFFVPIFCANLVILSLFAGVICLLLRFIVAILQFLKEVFEKKIQNCKKPVAYLVNFTALLIILK